jgi:hypothetical protein
MVQDPNDPQSGGEGAFGFGGEGGPPKEEKYNTRFLVANMQKERRQTQLIIGGIVLATVLGGTMWVLLGSDEPPKKPVAAGAAAAEVAPAPAAAAAAPTAAAPGAAAPAAVSPAAAKPATPAAAPAPADDGPSLP